MQFEVYGQYTANGIEEGNVIDLAFENGTISNVKVLSLNDNKAVFEVTGEAEREVMKFMQPKPISFSMGTKSI